jgi:hypothetical protein
MSRRDAPCRAATHGAVVRHAFPVASQRCRMHTKKSPSGQRQSSREQHEVEALLQVAAHRVGVACAIRTTEQVRAVHVPKAKGAYNELLERRDLKARSNKSRRERYLYALTALGQLPDDERKG